jgi:hypothetical protein
MAARQPDDGAAERKPQGQARPNVLFEAGTAMARHVARQSGWEHSDNQDGHFGGRGGRMIVAARR